MSDTKIVLITGANTGIGFEAVKALLRSDKQKYHIFLGSRSLEKAAVAIKDLPESSSTVTPVQIDVESDESIQSAYDFVKSKVDRLDALVNNAGAAFDAQIDKGTLTVREAFNKAYNINVTGANIVTETFLPLLLNSSDPRLLFNTSGLSSLADSSDPSKPFYQIPPAGLPKPRSATAYRASKAGLNMLMVEWTRLLKNDGVKVWCIAPGLLATNLGGAGPDFLRARGAKEPEFGGEGIRGVLEGKRDEDVGRVVREYDSPIQDW